MAAARGGRPQDIMKEETYPDIAYTPIFILAPAMAFIPALITWAVIPFGAPWDSPWGRIELRSRPCRSGSCSPRAVVLGIYGIVLAGWSSNKTPCWAACAQREMVSYEIAMGMCPNSWLMLAGNVSLNQVVELDDHRAALVERRDVHDCMADLLIAHRGDKPAAFDCPRRSPSSSLDTTRNTVR